MNYENEIMHYGVGHLHGGHSGRFPYGSGKNGKQRSKKQKKAEKYAKKYAELTGGRLTVKKSDNNQSSNNQQNQKPNARILDKPISTMTDQEIRSRINRIQLENQLASYINPNIKPDKLPKDKKEKYRKDAINRLQGIKDQVVWPSIYESGKSTLTSWLKTQGQNLLKKNQPPDPYKELKDLQYDMSLRGLIAKNYQSINSQGLSDILLNTDKLKKFRDASSKNAAQKDKEAIEKHIKREAKKAQEKAAGEVVKSGAQFSRNIMKSVGKETVSSVIATHRYTSGKNATYDTIKALSNKRNLTSSIVNDRADLFSTIANNTRNAEIVRNAIKEFDKKYSNFTPLKTNYKIKGFKTL